MEGQVVDKITSLTLRAADVKEIEGLKYTAAKHEVVNPPMVKPVQVMTLDSLIGAAPELMAVTSENANPYFVQVCSPTRVLIRAVIADKYAQREHLMTADIADHLGSFEFGRKYDQVKFIIELQSNFKRTDQLEDLISFASHVSVKDEATSTDDGTTQTVSARSGVHLEETAKVPNPVELQPFKTFPEIEIPGESFVFRVHKEHGDVKFALHKSESKAWELKTMQTIKEYISKGLKGITVV